MSVKKVPPAPLKFEEAESERTSVLDRRGQELMQSKFEYQRDLEGRTTKQFNEKIQLLVVECLEKFDFLGAFTYAKQFRCSLKTPFEAMGRERFAIISMVMDRAREAGVALPH